MEMGRIVLILKDSVRALCEVDSVRSKVAAPALTITTSTCVNSWLLDKRVRSAAGLFVSSVERLSTMRMLLAALGSAINSVVGVLGDRTVATTV